MATNNDDSMLLGLPMELLQRITRYLPLELTALRLTCKTIQAATFDQFTDRHCTVRSCFVLSAAQWTKLQNQLVESPRLASKIERIKLTTEVYDLFSYGRLQLAPEQRFSNIRDAQRHIYEYANSNEGLSSWAEETSRPGVATMTEVLSQVLQSAPHAAALLQMRLPIERSAWCREVFTAIASSKLAAVWLTIIHPFEADYETLLAEGEPDLLSCTSAITSLHLGSENHSQPRPTSLEQERLQFVKKIIQSAKNMTKFTLCLRRYATLPQPELITTELLHGEDFPSLEWIYLHHVSISEDVLKNLLAACKHKLTNITLTDVRLHPFTNGWQEIFRTISGCPDLDMLVLFSLTIGPRQHKASLSFASMKHGSTFDTGNGFCSIVMAAKRDVVAGTRELLSMPMEYI